MTKNKTRKRICASYLFSTIHDVDEAEHFEEMKKIVGSKSQEQLFPLR